MPGPVGRAGVRPAACPDGRGQGGLGAVSKFTNSPDAQRAQIQRLAKQCRYDFIRAKTQTWETVLAATQPAACHSKGNFVTGNICAETVGDGQPLWFFVGFASA